MNYDENFNPFTNPLGAGGQVPNPEDVERFRPREDVASSEQSAAAQNMNPYGQSNATQNTNPYGQSSATQNTNPYGQSSTAQNMNPYGQSRAAQNVNPYGQSANTQNTNPYGAATQGTDTGSTETEAQFKYQNYQVNMNQGTPGQQTYKNPYFQQGSSTYQRQAEGSTTSSNVEPKAHSNDTVKEKPTKEKKSGLTAKKIWIGIASAIVLGLIGGATFVGISYAGYHTLPGMNVASNDATNATDTTNDNNSGTDVTKPSTDSATPTSSTSTTSDATYNVNTTVIDVSEMVSDVITCVVAIDGTYSVNYGFGGNGHTLNATVSGSGIILSVNDTEMQIVTNAHVVEDITDGTMSVTFYDGSKAKATVKASKPSSDLAIITVQKANIPTDAIYSVAKIGDSTNVKVGEAAIAIGNSMGYGISVTTGIVSALNKSITIDSVVYENLIQTDAAINPGNSGGALFNAKGEVVGINSAKMNTENNVEGMGYAISISYVEDIIDDLSQEKLSESERGHLGVNGVTITSDISKTYGYPEGVLVRTVDADSAAAAAGIEKNDIIVSFDGEKVSTYDELYSRMFYYAVGDQIEIEFYRMNANGEFDKHTVTVTLTD